VAESDNANCFEAIPHSGLMSAIEERIVDRQVLKLLRAMLRAGVMEDRAIRRSDAGTPQGGVISPSSASVGGRWPRGRSPGRISSSMPWVMLALRVCGRRRPARCAGATPPSARRRFRAARPS
jgi:hypothetical protein